MIIGFTSGAYDVFHIGHLNIFKRAKEMCDYLIVGVNTDEFILRYKNKTPVIPFEERIAIVSAIKYVDEVIPQDDEGKIDAWHKYKYKYLFGGSDWEGREIVSELNELLKPSGGRVVLFPYTQTTSSTLLTELIRKQVGKL